MYFRQGNCLPTWQESCSSHQIKKTPSPSLSTPCDVWEQRHLLHSDNVLHEKDLVVKKTEEVRWSTQDR